MERTVFHALTTLEAEHWFGDAIVPAASVAAAPAAGPTEAALYRGGLRHRAEDVSEFQRTVMYGVLVLAFVAVLLTGFGYREGEVPWPLAAVSVVCAAAAGGALWWGGLRLMPRGRAALRMGAEERDPAARLLGEGGPATDEAWVRAVAWHGTAAATAGPLAPLARTLAAPAVPGPPGEDEEDAREAYREGDPAPVTVGPAGYVAGGVARAATVEALLAFCRAGHTPRLVWTAEDPVLRHPADVPFLFDALKARVEGALAAPVRSSGWQVALFVGLWATSGFQMPSFWLVMAVAEGFQAWTSLRDRKRLLPVTPGSIRLPPEPVEVSPWLLRVRGRSPVYTPWLLRALLAVAAVQLLPGSGSEAAGLVKDATRGGEWWRLLTGPVLHGHLLHLLMNYVTLRILGEMVERFGRRAHLPIVLTLSALGGSVASLLLVDATSVGISGGIMGCLGFLLVLGWRWRTHVAPGFFGSLVHAAALNAVIGLVGYGMIDNAAHGGGLLVGVALGFVLLPARPWEREEPAGVSRVGMLAAVPLIAACVLAVTRMIQAAVAG
jgi:membrane associated rhomboid family serine protease